MFVHMLKLVDYLRVQADNPWYDYYLVFAADVAIANIGLPLIETSLL